MHTDYLAPTDWTDLTDFCTQKAFLFNHEWSSKLIAKTVTINYLIVTIKKFVVTTEKFIEDLGKKVSLTKKIVRLTFIV